MAFSSPNAFQTMANPSHLENLAVKCPAPKGVRTYMRISTAAISHGSLIGTLLIRFCVSFERFLLRRRDQFYGALRTGESLN